MALIKGETEKYAKKVAPSLDADEVVVAAVRVTHNTKSIGVIGAVALVGNAVIGPDTQIIPPGSLAERAPRKGRSLWVLTDRRMLFFNAGNVRLGDPLTTFGLPEVGAVTATKAKVQFGKLAIDFADGSRIVYDMTSDREATRITDQALALLAAG